MVTALYAAVAVAMFGVSVPTFMRGLGQVMKKMETIKWTCGISNWSQLVMVALVAPPRQFYQAIAMGIFEGVTGVAMKPIGNNFLLKIREKN